MTMDDLMQLTIREGFMDWRLSLAAGFALLWVLCFINGNAVYELRLLFQALTKLACHLYLAHLQLRRAASHFFRCFLSTEMYAQQQPPPYSPEGDTQQSPHHGRRAILHLIEAICVVFETIPNLACALLSLGEAFFHAKQGLVYVLAAPLRSIQALLFSQMNGEKERWDKERHREKESEMNSKVLEYISLCNQDPFTALSRRKGPRAS